ncbi:MAG: AIR synthase related protein [Collinsella sp.]
MHNDNLLVGFDTSDDASVFRVGENLGLVQSIDFFPPMVDDPFLFGQIAAANSLSDITHGRAAEPCHEPTLHTQLSGHRGCRSDSGGRRRQCVEAGCPSRAAIPSTTTSPSTACP